MPGCYDSIETVLDASKIPYQFAEDERSFGDAKVIFINCSGEYNLNKFHIEKFVKKGGFLVSTDWALDQLISKTFGNIRYNHHRTTNQEVVDVEVADPHNFYVKGAFPKGIKPAWWLETASYPIEIVNPKNVDVLIKSNEMKKKYGSDAVGVTFEYGAGRVFHFISHFKLQQSREYIHPSKKDSKSFAKDILDLNDQEIASLKINQQQSYAAVETAYTSAMIIHNIIAARKMGYNGRQ